MSEIQHPQLGTLKFDEYHWLADLRLPEFEQFCYGEDSACDENQPCLLVDATDSSDTPSEAVFQLVTDIIENQKTLLEAVVMASLAEFNGTGPETGMWWHGEPSSVLEHHPSPGNRQSDTDTVTLDDLFQLMGRPSVLVEKANYSEKRWDGGATPKATLDFSSAFDTEHGIGILTDGKVVLGIGYQGEADPFLN